MSYTYQWELCDAAGASCTDIVGATSTNYIVAAGDVGGTIRVRVSDGVTTATSSQTGVIGGVAPSPGTFGTSLPARMSEASGATVTVTTLSGLQAALTGAAAGKIIQVRAGTYGAGDTSSFSFTCSGTRANPVHVVPYPGDAQPVLAKLFQPSGGAIRFRGIAVTTNSYPTDPRFGQGGANPGGNVGFWINSTDVEIDGCDIRNATMSGLFGMADRVQVWNSRIHNNGTTHDDHGIYWGNGGASGVVANCVIDHNACFGFQIQYASTGVIVTNCTLIYNGLSFAGSGTVQAGSANNILYVNCISAFNGEFGYKSYVAANTIRRCLAYGNPQGATYGPFASVDLVASGDPLLDGTYKPGVGSAALGVGDPLYMPPLDYYGVARTVVGLGAVAGP